MTNWLVILNPIASAVIWFALGRMSKTLDEPRSNHDEEIGRAHRQIVESIFGDAQMVGSGAVITRRCVVTLRGCDLTIDYRLDTDQMPAAKEVEARR